MCFLYNTALYKYLCIILTVTIVAAAAVAAVARVELESKRLRSRPLVKRSAKELPKNSVYP